MGTRGKEYFKMQTIVPEIEMFQRDKLRQEFKVGHWI